MIGDFECQLVEVVVVVVADVILVLFADLVVIAVGVVGLVGVAVGLGLGITAVICIAVDAGDITVVQISTCRYKFIECRFDCTAQQFISRLISRQ